MVRLQAAHRAVLADKLPDLANLFAGGCVIGQFLGPEPVSGWLLTVGLVMWAVVMGGGLLIAEARS